jgi:hypothetical protein
MYSTAQQTANHQPTPIRPGERLRLQAKALKATIVLDPAALTAIVVPPGSPPVAFTINVDGRRVTGKFNAKSLRRAISTINEHDEGQVAVVVQGRLARERDADILVDAGIAAQVKGPRPDKD